MHAQVKVCIIDTGLNYLHPDLAANVWMNPVEMAGPGATAANGYKNGIDDDGDGAQPSMPHLIMLRTPSHPHACMWRSHACCSCSSSASPRQAGHMHA